MRDRSYMCRLNLGTPATVDDLHTRHRTGVGVGRFYGGSECSVTKGSHHKPLNDRPLECRRLVLVALNVVTASVLWVPFSQFLKSPAEAGFKNQIIFGITQITHGSSERALVG